MLDKNELEREMVGALKITSVGKDNKYLNSISKMYPLETLRNALSQHMLHALVVFEARKKMLSDRNGADASVVWLHDCVYAL